MERSSTVDIIDVLVELSPWLWITAVLFFGIGDMITTFVGLYMEWAVEAGPVASWLINQYGIEMLFLLKVVTFLAFYKFWKLIPDPYNIGIPLGLTILGAEVTVWNISILFVSVT